MDEFDRDERRRKANRFLGRDESVSQAVSHPALSDGGDDEPTVVKGAGLHEERHVPPVVPPAPVSVLPLFWAKAKSAVWFVLGFLVAVLMIPESRQEVLEERARLIQEADALRGERDELQRRLAMASRAQGVEQPMQSKVIDLQRKQARDYAATLRRQGAQAAAESVLRWSEEWLAILANPQGKKPWLRRAESLERFVGAMQGNVDPDDFLAWQQEFLGARWVAELHLDLDGDGLPGLPSHAPAFKAAGIPACRLLMILNQWSSDGTWLADPTLKCGYDAWPLELRWAKGKAEDESVSALKRSGFNVTKLAKGVRLVSRAR